ncbi:META domain-containing protein [uncultured Polaribacter sp.]|uniref:META domain-containing protein n=1 Tax=uncultured Polaribacter sp. TaxID=174711 RepID=UPI002634B6F4|nr:META domain-containing protein [uncultured Polaribacter sp.]
MKIKILLLIVICTTIMSCNSIKNNNDTASNTITEKYWKLKTLKGKKVKMVENQKREIYITLKTKDNRFTGFAGCNVINGEYILDEGNRIKFGEIASTKMFCPNTDEQTFLDVLNTVNNYTITNDILFLNIGKQASLAVFEAVYLN